MKIYRGKALNYIYSEAKRLEKLSHKLMELMSISKDRIELQSINILDFANKTGSKIILDEIKLKIDVVDAIVIADIHLLEVVIRNLIENSKKSKPVDNQIIIKGEITSNKRYRISVIDKGKGIPKEHIDRVTEDFYMVDKSRSRENGGSGIGLSLCKKILDIHDSELKIESKENIGTTIYFDLKIQTKKEEK